MAELKEPTAGQRVCVVGVGADRLVHEHPRVARLTKTLIVTDNRRRFRRAAAGFDGWPSTPSRPYGGVRLYVTCQRKAPTGKE